MAFAITISGAVSAADVDLTVTGTVNTVPSSAVFAKEANNITIPNIKNNGVDTATNVVVSLYASDVNSGSTAVNSTTIASLAGGATTTINLFDPTIRNLEGGSVIYTVKLDPDDLIAETNEDNNIASSGEKPVKYNGYKGKRYWEGGSDITTKHTYDLNGDLVYYTQPVAAYKGVGWTSRTETWTAADLPIPATGTVEKVLLFFSYNWDQTPGGYPILTTTFNGININLGTPYRDWSNFGSWPDYEYGLYPAVDVTSLFVKNGNNTLITTAGEGNKNAIYPSTLDVIYSDPTKTSKVIYINEECDELGYSESLYATTPGEATAYAIFNGVNTTNLYKATLHSFAGSAGADEGNLFWNGVLIAGLAWQGTSSTASALVTDVTGYIIANNEAGIQGTTSGGMAAIQQFLILEYGADLIVTDIKANVGAGDYMFANGPNVISVTVKNNGTVASLATTLDVDVNGTIYTVNVPALEAGASSTVTVTDTTSHTGGSSVPVNANADPDRNIPETNTSNNSLNINLTVYNNGYKGKQYTDDEHNSVETKQTFNGKYDVIYSNGNAAYRGSGSWANPYTASWTSTDLPIPTGATVVSARLYQGYTWNTLLGIPDFMASFNGNTITALAHYSDTKGYGSSNYPSGLLVYDVTSFFNKTGNTLTLTNGTTTGATTALYGSYLIVVYQYPNTTNKNIYINDGVDMLYSGTARSVSDEEGTGRAKFNDVNTTGVGNAQVINILASANEEGKSKFFFNGQEYSGFWEAYNAASQTGFSVYDVTSALINGLNTASLQSFMVSGSGDNMVTLGSILITTFTSDDTTVPTVSASPAGGLYKSPQNVTLTATDNRDPNPKICYTLDGTTPTTASTLYTGPILISGITLKFIAVDGSGNISPVQTETYTIDTITPTITSIDPTNNAVKVSAGKTIKVTFSEDIKSGSLWIELKNSSKTVIPFTATVNGKVLTIDPTGNLAESLYTLGIHTGAVTDMVGNPVALKTTKFSVGTSPTITSTDPVNGATKVAASKIIKVIFSENIKKGSKFWVELKNSSKKAISFTSSTSGKVLTIKPKSKLAESLYTLCIHTGAVTDQAGNPVAVKTTKFSTGIPPTVSKMDPKSGAIKVAASKTIKVTFNENIKKGSKFWIELKNSAGKAIPFKASVSGKVLTINPTRNLAESLYTLGIHTGAVTDQAGNPVALKTTKFSVGTSPTVTNTDPKNSATRVARNKTIKVTFNENIKAGSNFWVELKASNSKSVKIGKSISGKVLTITHPRLAANTRYTLGIHTGAVTDQAGNPVELRSFRFTTGRT